MLRFYPAPQSHFRPQQRYTYFDDGDDEEVSYYEYQRAVREQRERRALEEAQARRRAQEEREQYLRRLRAQQQEEEEYRQWQLERRRAAYLEQQRQKHAAIAEYKRRQLEQQQQRQQHQRQQHQQFDIFAQLFGPPAPPSHIESQSQPQASSSATTLPAPPVINREPSTPRMSYTEAVTLIQSLAKDKISLAKRLHALRDIASRLEAAKASFQLPESLIFNSEISTPSSPVLAFSVENKAYHAHEETLTKLLTELDSITSEGAKKVKEERKRLAVQIEEELNRLDTLKVEQWQKQMTDQKVEAENGPAHAELEKEETVEAENGEAGQVPNDTETSKADSVNDAEGTSIESATLAASDDAPQVEHRMEVDEIQSATPAPEQDKATQPVHIDEVEPSEDDLSTTSQIDAASAPQSDTVGASAGPGISTSTQSPTAEADSQENSPLEGYQVDSDNVAEVKDEDKIAEDGEQERVENVDDQDSGSDFEMIE